MAALKGKDMSDQRGHGGQRRNTVRNMSEITPVNGDEGVQEKNQLLASFAGNFMEFYDFSLYGGVADVLGDRFFPGGDNQQLLLSYAVFGAAFLCRPLGGLLLGKLGDTYGRKRALELSIWMMAIPSLLIGCLPTYGDINLGATALLISLRLIQGLSSGGELPGVFTHLLESSYKSKICNSVGFAISGAHMGACMGLAVVVLIRFLLTDDQMNDFGWRIPFLTNIVVGVVAIYLRRKLLDASVYVAYSVQVAEGSMTAPTISEVWSRHWRAILMLIVAAGAWGPCFYVTFIWMPTYEKDILDPGVNEARIIAIFALLVLSICTPWVGSIADRVLSRSENFEITLQNLLFYAYTGLVFVSIPSFLVASMGGVACYVAAVLMAIPFMALAGCTTGAFVASQFPVDSRYLSTSLSYNLGQCVFSSSALFVVTYMAQSWATWTPGVFVAAVAFVNMTVLGCSSHYFESQRAIVRKRLSIATQNKRRKTDANAGSPTGSSINPLQSPRGSEPSHV